MLPELLGGATSAVDLGEASGFAVIAGTGITVAGAVNTTAITGDIGAFPTPAITGLENVILDGTNHGDGESSQLAKADLMDGYADAAGRAYDVQYSGAFDLGGQTLNSGVYNSASSLFLSGSLTLDAQGNPNAVWIFQAGSTLITASSSMVNLVGGAQASNIFWQVGSSATLGTYTNFAGSILALTSITVTTGSTVNGRLLANNGAVTMDSNTITVPQGGGAVPVEAVDVFWTGSGTSWSELGSWSTDRDITHLAPALMAGSTELATFNTLDLSSAQTINMDAEQSIRGLSFTSEATVLLQAGGEDRVLTLAGSGIDKSGSGEVIIGSLTSGQQVRLELSADQSWTSSDNTTAITILNGVSAGTTTTTDRTLMLDGTSTAANTVAGSIGDHELGVMILKKSGTGNWNLAGDNTYTGATTVSAGRLVVNGSTSAGSAIEVTSGGTLAGSGRVGGNTTIAVGGALSPGNSPGLLTVSGTTVFDSGSIFEWELDTAQLSPETTRGIAYDGLNTSTVYGSGAVFRIMLTGTQDFTDSLWNQDLAWTDIFKSADGGTNLTDWAVVFSGGFQYAYNGQSAAPSGAGSFALSGNTLTWSAVPEPSNALALAGMLAGSALLRRRAWVRSVMPCFS
jgi:autotransporter-associated beta strand protein